MTLLSSDLVGKLNNLQLSFCDEQIVESNTDNVKRK